jgi:hypothetical protein
MGRPVACDRTRHLPMTGQTLRRYTVPEKLGEGGMGVDGAAALVKLR